MAKEKLRLIAEGSFDGIRLIGAIVNRIAREIDMPDEDVSNSELAVVEACNNVLLHGHNGNSEENITVGFIMEDDRVEFRVYDKGKGFELEDKDFYKDLMSETSRGIFIIKSLMDEVYYERFSEENILRMIKYLKK